MAKLTQEQLDWIYKQDWFPKYCANLVKQGKLKRWENFMCDPQSLIDGAFSWDITDEGIFYWSDVSDQWSSYLKGCEQNKTKELTLQEIADKFNISVKNLRIKK